MTAYHIHGALGSPYSVKVRAAFRYKRIAHTWVQGGVRNTEVMGKVKVPVIPVVETPAGTFMNDSTPLLQEIDRLHPERSLYPQDEALRFLALMLEDYADEWMTKAMFHFRWFRTVDQDQMSHWLAFDRLMGVGEAQVDAAAKFFRERQVGRMALVGCTPETAPVIEESTFAAWRHLESLALSGPYLFGGRPSVADFAITGQYSQLATDPTPQALMRSLSPYLFRWLMNLDDASGIDGAWTDGLEGLHPSVFALAQQIGAVYFPFLLANDAAIKAGAETFTVTLLGRPFSQGVFKYQQKCLSELRRHYAALSMPARERIDPWLARAHCLDVLKGDRA